MRAWMAAHPWWTLVIGIILGAFPLVIVAVISAVLSAAFNTVATVAEGGVGAGAQAFNGDGTYVDDGSGG